MEIKNNNLRPKKLDDFIGQNNIKKQLKILCYGANKRGSSLPHLLFYGPPGLGKTSLAMILAEEMGVNIQIVSASSLQDIQSIVSVLASLDENDILFIDEIHNLGDKVEEILYSAMEDNVVNIMYKNDENYKPVKLNVSSFCLIGATTIAGRLNKPLLDRFVSVFKFDFYDTDELGTLIFQNSKLLNLDITFEACLKVAECSKNTPRIANNLLRKILDFSLYKNIDKIDESNIEKILSDLNVNYYGLSNEDIQILSVLSNKFNDRAVSIETIAIQLNQSEVNIKEINEPFLVYAGLVERTKQGRKITKFGKQVLNKCYK